jgi:hypothetical protein
MTVFAWVRMSVVVGWDNPEKTIFRFTLTDKWTQAELKEADPQFRDALGQVSYPVVTLVDIRRGRITPSGNLFDAGVPFFREPLPNEDLLVVVTASRALRQTCNAFIGLLRMMFPERAVEIVFAGSEAEAYRLIEQHWCERRLHGRC